MKPTAVVRAVDEAICWRIASDSARILFASTVHSFWGSVNPGVPSGSSYLSISATLPRSRRSRAVSSSINWVRSGMLMSNGRNDATVPIIVAGIVQSIPISAACSLLNCITLSMMRLSMSMLMSYRLSLMKGSKKRKNLRTATGLVFAIVRSTRNVWSVNCSMCTYRRSSSTSPSISLGKICRSPSISLPMPPYICLKKLFASMPTRFPAIAYRPVSATSWVNFVTSSALSLMFPLISCQVGCCVGVTSAFGAEAPRHSQSSCGSLICSLSLFTTSDAAG